MESSAKDEYGLLTRAKLAHIIKESEKAKEAELLDARLNLLSSKGQNFSGDIVFCSLRARVNKSEKEYSWAVKLPPMASKERMPMHRAIMMEEKEIEFYTKVLPAWKRLITDRRASFDITCFDSPYSEFHRDWQEGGSILVLQDLRAHGFRNAVDRKWGLNLHHAELALEELAKFHALGYAYLKSYPGGVRQGVDENTLMTRDYVFADPLPFTKGIIDSFDESLIPTSKSLLKSVQEPGQDFVGAMIRCHEQDNLFEMRNRLYSQDTKGFKTLCHGDPHLNNLLFKLVSSFVCNFYLTNWGFYPPPRVKKPQPSL